MVVRVLGCGNPLCADDSVGLMAVRRLAVEGVPRGVEALEAGTPGVGLLDLLSDCDRAIIVDAVMSGAAPGTIHRFGPEALPPRDLLPLSLHGVNVADALQLGAAALPGELPPVTVIGVEIEDRTPYRRGLSPKVAAALPRVVAAVRAELEA